MSGGSFDYLYKCDDLVSLAEKRARLREMLEALKLDYPDTEAARSTEELAHALDVLDETVRLGVQRLSRVWKAIEWERSGDTTAEATREAVEAHERETDAALAPLAPWVKP